MRTSKIDGWYVRKHFAHLDYPLDFDQAKALVTAPDRVAVHPFLPFIGYMDKKRRFMPKQRHKYKVKERPIKYCSHRDGYIHSYYAKILSESYENFLYDKAWGKCVIGYRSGIGTNIHMANSAFFEIKNRSSCCVIAIDISDFFGSIDHRVLLNNLNLVLGVDRLPSDWFNVYKSMSRYAWIDLDDLFIKLKIDPKNPPFPYCSIKEFRNVRDGFPDFVKTNNLTHGIPQGSPISALFSNVYMIDFDNDCYNFINKKGGSYRRYSDDILIICDEFYVYDIYRYVVSKICDIGDSIKISEEKTDISSFYYKSNGCLSCDRPISYLGFSFDGVRVYLRPKTLSRYYRRVTYAARHAGRIAWREGSSKVFKRKLFRQFTHLGKANFYSYARRASGVMNDETPKKQLRRHFEILRRKIKNRGK